MKDFSCQTRSTNSGLRLPHLIDVNKKKLKILIVQSENNVNFIET